MIEDRKPDGHTNNRRTNAAKHRNTPGRGGVATISKLLSEINDNESEVMSCQENIVSLEKASVSVSGQTHLDGCAREGGS